MQDAAESDLDGDVAPLVSSGVVRYRIWPARRHPWRLVLALAAVIGGGVATHLAFENAFWTFIVAGGLTMAAAPFFFPTLVSLDGPALNLRHLGIARNFSLSTFQRFELVGDILPRVELLTRARLSPVDKVDSLVVPLPDNPTVAKRVEEQLKTWVGRQPTGKFSLDADHVPEDEV